MRSLSQIRGPVCGLLAAVLFGMSAPLGKALIASAGPVALASLFYLGAGLILSLVPRRFRGREAALRAGDIPRLAAVTVAGGLVGPVLMLWGLARVSGITGALMLNLEAPFTMAVALGMFGEHLGGRAAVGALTIVGGGLLLGGAPSGADGSVFGVLALAGACLAWALDNNLTQRLSLRDPVSVVRIKAFGAGLANLAIALAIGDRFPAGAVIAGALLVGALSYGVSIVLDAYALRFVGAAREAAYFATAPFFGAALAVPILGERVGVAEVCAGLAMAAGVSLLVVERHSHLHRHEPVTHDHVHVHDAHHQHAHEPGVGRAPHSHVHTHAPLTHEHPHVSDAHHRHRH